MKLPKLLLILLITSASTGVHAQGLLNKIKSKVNQRKDQKIDKAIDNGLDKADAAATIPAGNTGTNPQSQSTAPSNPTTEAGSTAATTAGAKPASFKTYANYDFVPGSTIIFEDNFSEDADGEFPSHWDLINGQGVLNKMQGEESFFLTDGNYVRVAPLMKKANYLPAEFTLEFDTYLTEAAYGIRVHFIDADKQDLFAFATNSGGVDYSFTDKALSGSFAEENGSANYFNKWHHFAFIFKNGQAKVYCDAARVLVIPNVGAGAKPATLQFTGIGNIEAPIIFKNIRIAEGGGMNTPGKKFTDSKIITHGINFDVNKAVIKPESMGTLNSIVQLMKDNPEVKFEVGGHTDSDGEDAANMKLSQARAEAVRTQLISMGVDAARLSAKGYGESKPVADNSSFEGKANNRRVEFVKK